MKKGCICICISSTRRNNDGLYRASTLKKKNTIAAYYVQFGHVVLNSKFDFFYNIAACRTIIPVFGIIIPEILQKYKNFEFSQIRPNNNTIPGKSRACRNFFKLLTCDVFSEHYFKFLLVYCLPIIPLQIVDKAEFKIRES